MPEAVHSSDWPHAAARRPHVRSDERAEPAERAAPRSPPVVIPTYPSQRRAWPSPSCAQYRIAELRWGAGCARSTAR
eukprot:3832840-Prymnesium_polylepis.1